MRRAAERIFLFVSRTAPRKRVTRACYDPIPPGKRLSNITLGQSLRGSANVIVNHVFGAVTQSGNDAAIRAAKIPATLSVGPNRVTAFVAQPVMTCAQRNQALQIGLTTLGPVLDVIRLDVTGMRATRKTATAIT